MSSFINRGLLMATVAALLAAPSAFAASNTCKMAKEPWKCTTQSVPANPQGNFVHIDVSPRVKYKVYDSKNGAMVHSGRGGWTGTRKTITGLYGKYHVKAEGPGFVTINNN
ncbi:hypothetical protein [Hyalangium rubrum]|uniref:Uncharacterized protein n=1 Tax=Hyalangium rubrum TaxID=3103134 RepID=A0ABU5H3I6_9BACT|nr:hypothetical protein [Hyalangium sp. s54d21]MDY7228036.1 hypothetical protein [Hyalangium sp. s54d21]